MSFKNPDRLKKEKNKSKKIFKKVTQKDKGAPENIKVKKPNEKSK